MVAGGGKTTKEDLMDFLRCMAISVFDRFCQSVPMMDEHVTINSPSPLQIWQDNRAEPGQT